MSSSKQQQEKYEKILKQLLRLTENKYCMHCSATGPTYAVPKYGIFICTQCSGVQRDYARCKSVSMSKFDQEEVEWMKERGNGWAVRHYLANWSPRFLARPNDREKVRLNKWIKQVFEEKQFYVEDEKEENFKDSTAIGRISNSSSDGRRSSSFNFTLPASRAPGIRSQSLKDSQSCSKKYDQARRSCSLIDEVMHAKPQLNSDFDPFSTNSNIAAKSRSTDLNTSTSNLSVGFQQIPSPQQQQQHQSAVFDPFSALDATPTVIPTTTYITSKHPTPTPTPTPTPIAVQSPPSNGPTTAASPSFFPVKHATDPSQVNQAQQNSRFELPEDLFFEQSDVVSTAQTIDYVPNAGSFGSAQQKTTVPMQQASSSQQSSKEYLQSPQQQQQQQMLTSMQSPYQQQQQKFPFYQSQAMQQMPQVQNVPPVYQQQPQQQSYTQWPGLQQQGSMGGFNVPLGQNQTYSQGQTPQQYNPYAVVQQMPGQLPIQQNYSPSQNFLQTQASGFSPQLVPPFVSNTQTSQNQWQGQELPQGLVQGQMQRQHMAFGVAQTQNSFQQQPQKLTFNQQFSNEAQGRDVFSELVTELGALGTDQGSSQVTKQDKVSSNVSNVGSNVGYIGVPKTSGNPFA